MFSKKLLWAFAIVFLFLSVTALINNLPSKKNKRIYNEILETFPYEIRKELGGLDIVDKRTNKDLDVTNSKVFIAFDELLKKWAKTHIKLKNNTLYIYDDNQKIVKKIELKTNEEKEFIKEFFGL